MRNQIFKQFKSVGFQFVSFKSFGKNKCLEYKYYPKYFENKHYTLILFIDRCFDVDTKKYDLDRNFRLYIHSNRDGSFIDTPFQISDFTDNNRNFLNEQINTLFKEEIRNLKFKKILNN